MRLYNKLKKLEPQTVAGNSNKGLLVIAYAGSGPPITNFTINFYNLDGSTFSQEYTLLVPSSASGAANSTNNILLPFKAHSWIETSGSHFVYELY